MVAMTDGSVVIELPSNTECNKIVNEKHEIPTLDVVNYHPLKTYL